jgi:hypothetical protein
MGTNEPFLSRPRIRKKTDMAPSESSENEIIEGVIEEEEASFLPVAYSPEIAAQSAYRQAESVPTKPKRRFGFGLRIVDPALFLLAVALIAGGIFFTLMNIVPLPDSVERWYPAMILLTAILWSFIALVRRDATAFLGGAGVGGLSLSLLMQTQDIAPFEETAVGITLISVGMAIVIRGLLMRQRQPI